MRTLGCTDGTRRTSMASPRPMSIVCDEEVLWLENTIFVILLREVLGWIHGLG